MEITDLCVSVNPVMTGHSPLLSPCAMCLQFVLMFGHGIGILSIENVFVDIQWDISRALSHVPDNLPLKYFC